MKYLLLLLVIGVVRPEVLGTYSSTSSTSTNSTTSSSTSSSSSVGSSCVAKKSCGECIRSPDCVWCSQPRFEKADKSPLPRCNTATKHAALPIELRCDVDHLMNPNHEFHLIRDDPISVGDEGGGGAVQLRPQHVSLKLRVGQSTEIRLTYAQAEDYPVDLYYLMDLSKSMEDDKEELSNLGDKLAETMQRLTSNFRLGFGSFVDKVVMPFVSTVEKKLESPCDKCVPPYGYRNHMALTTDTNTFSNVMSLSRDTSRFAGEVKNARVSGNLDAPEGGFDAIMQAIVCDQIGWRSLSRRLLVFSTDASFHYAGDGKLGGIVKPNDGHCHMDIKGEYTHSTLQDYPSVAQVNSVVKEKAINMIFAVTSEQIEIYKRLSAHVEGATCGVLAANSSNVVELVREQYQKITSAVELRDTASGPLRLRYFSRCLGNELIETSRCEGLRVGQAVEFSVRVEVTECPASPVDWNQRFQIYRVGINESLTVDLEMLCQCPCEIPGNPGYEVFSGLCGGFGTAKCGVCECDERHFGSRCECDARGGGSRVDDDRACVSDNTTGTICGNRGTCECGLCQCHLRPDPIERIYGPHCECDNFSCERYEGELCSGGEHGECECGRCVCRQGWSGESCSCSTDTSPCMEPGKEKACSGNGECVCGRCVCSQTETFRYSGRFCEKCPTCPDDCERIKDCVQCHMHKTGRFKEPEDCLEECSKFPPIEPVDIAQHEDSEEEKYCAFIDEEDDCRFYFLYGFDEEGRMHVKAQITKDCPPEPPIFWIIFGVVGAIVIVGLFFLCLWKLLTHIADRAEYARFEKERKSAKWDAGENPIYKQATSTFKNPIYAGR